MTIWGVDPGLKGSAAMSEGSRCTVLRLGNFCPSPGDRVFLERPLSVTGQSTKGNESMWMRYGQLVDLCRRTGAIVEEVHPRTWQAAIGLSAGPREPKKSHKRRIAATVRRCFVSIDGGSEDDLDSAGILLYALGRTGREAVT